MADEIVKILVCDDEKAIRELVREYLYIEGFEIVEAYDGVSALNIFKAEKPDLIVMDIMMPNMDGWSACREIRRESKVPIIMLTARGEEYDKIFAFELGVDDYMVKPFSPKELILRIKAIIRRSKSNTQIVEHDTVFSLGRVILDQESHTVNVSGERVNLTPKEYELLYFFMKNPNKVLTREKLLENVWGFDFYGDDRTVDTHIKMLRNSLADCRDYIVTVWGTGYKFEVNI